MPPAAGELCDRKAGCSSGGTLPQRESVPAGRPPPPGLGIGERRPRQVRHYSPSLPSSAIAFLLASDVRHIVFHPFTAAMEPLDKFRESATATVGSPCVRVL